MPSQAMSFQTTSLFRLCLFRQQVFSDFVFSDYVFSDYVFSDLVFSDYVFSDLVFSDLMSLQTIPEKIGMKTFTADKHAEPAFLSKPMHRAHWPLPPCSVWLLAALCSASAAAI